MQCKPCPVCGGDVQISREQLTDGRRNYTLTCWACAPEGLKVRVVVPSGMPLELIPRISLAIGAAWNELQELVAAPTAAMAKPKAAAALAYVRARLAAIGRQARGQPP